MDNRYRNTNTSDIPFEIFSLFSRGNQAVHAGALLLAADLCSRDVEGAVQYDVFLDAIRDAGFMDGKEENASAQSPESAEINILKNCGLLRRQSRRDQSENRWVDYIYMTGRGQKAADFLVSISQTDIQQTKEANIQSALLNMREAAGDDVKEDAIQGIYGQMDATRTDDSGLQEPGRPKKMKARRGDVLWLSNEIEELSRGIEDFLTSGAGKAKETEAQRIEGEVNDP